MSSYYFTVEIDGIQTDRFFECDGLDMSATVFETEEGGYNISTHKRIGHNRSPNIILKKVVNKNNELVNWYQNNINGKFERKNISVILMNSSLDEVKRWDIHRAFPCRWKCSTLDANDNSLIIETIEITYG